MLFITSSLFPTPPSSEFLIALIFFLNNTNCLYHIVKFFIKLFIRSGMLANPLLDLDHPPRILYLSLRTWAGCSAKICSKDYKGRKGVVDTPTVLVECKLLQPFQKANCQYTSKAINIQTLTLCFTRHFFYYQKFLLRK